MILSRAIAAIPSTNRSLLRSLSLFQSSNLSTTSTRPRWSRKPKPQPQPQPPVIPGPATQPSIDAGAPPAPKPSPPGPAVWPRPSEIPWQPKVANSVHLIGSVAIPVQIDVAPDGRYWAVSVLRQDKSPDFPPLWIPMVFEGDLAQIAACHIKENDLVYITGQISGEQSPLTTEQKQASIQVMVHDISYVQKSLMMKKPIEQNELASNHSENSAKNVNNEDKLWQDLITNPEQWRDHRLDKKNGLVKPRYPDFKQKLTGQSLWLNRAPEWIRTKLERVDIDVNDVHPKQESNGHTSPTKISDDGSTQWDIRAEKTMGKESKESKLPNNSYNAKRGSTQWNIGAEKTMVGKESKESKLPKNSNNAERERVEAFWKELLESPNNWWDNRSNKFNPRSPDFKHKVTGEALWISSKSTPTWVRPNLPPVKPKQEVNVARGNITSLEH